MEQHELCLGFWKVFDNSDRGESLPFLVYNKLQAHSDRGEGQAKQGYLTPRGHEVRWTQDSK